MILRYGWVPHTIAWQCKRNLEQVAGLSDDQVCPLRAPAPASRNANANALESHFLLAFEVLFALT